jgi:O-succinylbenzoate synthase
VCTEAGVGAFVGGFFETGLGRSANAALASVAGFTLPGDLSAPSSYLVDDPFTYPPVVVGRVAVPENPGIAPGPDPGSLERRTVAVHPSDARPLNRGP